MKKEIIYIDDNGNCSIIDISKLSVEHRGQNELYYYDGKPLVGFGKLEFESTKDNEDYIFKVKQSVINGSEFKNVPYPAGD